MNPILALLAAAPSPIQIEAQKIIDEGLAPGMSVYVRKEGRELAKFAVGYADVEMKRPMTIRSVHELASISKPFTAVATLKLADQGKLSLEDPLSKFVENTPEAWKSVTVRHLLNHTSGLPDYLSPFLDMRKETTAKQLLESVHRRKMRFEPGTKFEYSNTGYLALGLVIEKASGRKFTDFTMREVVRPAGMRHAFPSDPNAKARDIARGYERKEGKWFPEQFVSAGYSALGDGFLMASAEDLIAWHETLRAGRILKVDTWKTAFEPTPLSPKGQRYGAGFIVEREGPKPTVAHTGGWVGTSTFWLSDLEKDTCVIVLINGDNVPTGRIIRPIMTALAAD